MNAKQEQFCKEYLIDLNAAKAAKRAGYSEDSAKSIGYELLNTEEISERISHLMAERSERCEVTADEILFELKYVGMSNIQDYMTDNLEVKPLCDIPKEKAKAIKSIKKTVTEFDGGCKTVVEFVLHDKLSGLDKLGRHIGLYNKDESSKSNITLRFDSQDEQLGSDVQKD